MNQQEYLTPIEEAQSIISEAINKTQTETISFIDGYNRILAEDIISTISIPPLDNSAMDGYAVQFADIENASQENPIELKITGEIQAGGEFANFTVTTGTTVRIMTGAPIPKGTDIVIPVENLQENEETIIVTTPLKNKANVRFAGEDIKIGQIVLKEGDNLDSAEIGLLASMNAEQIKVYKKPKVAIIATGDEIVEPGMDINDGQIRNSNAYTLITDMKKYGANPTYLGIAGDTNDNLKIKLKEAMDYDIIITTGGVSMGRYDLVKDVVRRFGFEIEIEKMKMKPGKPLAFGTDGKRLFFGLPGNPVSTMIASSLFVRPAIKKMMGSAKFERPQLDAILQEDIKKKSGRRHFNRGFFSVKDGKVYVSTTGDQGSGILRSMNEANCYLIVDEETTSIKSGNKVKIELFDHKEI